MTAIKPKFFTTRRKLKWILGLILLAGLGFGALMVFGTYSDGNRVGYVLKASKKGYVFKTYEGEMNTGMFPGSNTQGNMTATTWNFSMPDRAIYEQVEQAMEHDHKVKLYYKEKFVQLDVVGESKYIVYKVEELRDEPQTAPTSTTKL
ncbi:MAG: hypothetical protein ABIV51_14635 [Saprospiraceae bacterium]